MRGDSAGAASLDARAVAALLPHRHPFLFIDRAIVHEPGRRVVGIKSVSHGEPYLSAMPAAILMEAAAQTGAVMLLSDPANRGRLTHLVGIERLRLRGAVHAGDVIEIEARSRHTGGRVSLVAAIVRVAGRTVATARMTFALAPSTLR